MLEGETAATYLRLSVGGGCAAGKRLWHSRTESLGGPARVVHAVCRIPSRQLHCAVARSLVYVRTDFVHLSVSGLDTPCGSALLNTVNEVFRPQGGYTCWLFKINFSTSALKAKFDAFVLPYFPS